MPSILTKIDILRSSGICSAEGIKPDPRKSQAIKEMSAPININEVRSFLGMCRFYRNYVPNFKKICCLLYALIEESVKFKWE